MAVSVMPSAGCVRLPDTGGRWNKANLYRRRSTGRDPGVAGREGVEMAFMDSDFGYSVILEGLPRFEDWIG